MNGGKLIQYQRWLKWYTFKISFTIKGGVFFLEIKDKGRDKGWNVHIHCLVEARGMVIPYTTKKAGKTVTKANISGSGVIMRGNQLSKEWHARTGNSFIVDISPINGKYGLAGAVKYITKYVSKDLYFDGFERCEEYKRLMKGKRLMSCFGDWYASYNSLVKEAKERFKLNFICPACDSNKWMTSFELDSLINSKNWRSIGKKDDLEFFIEFDNLLL